ncbi:MAG: ECF transporter S component [Ruminococcaceae bacterium]|nr:ECF transporter S component [Oscillospiraceae bacterium]
MKKYNVKHMVTLAMLTALAYALVCLIRIPVVLFLSYEPKDVIITIGGLLFNPAAAFIISLVTALLEMVSISDTGVIGALMNLLSSAAFSCTAAFIYKKRRTLGGAVVGLAAGSVAMVVTMLLWNWLITPLYQGWPREAVAEMLVPVFLPFNLLKAGLNSALVLCLYKPLVGTLRKADLISPQINHAGKSKLGVYLIGGGLLITCILALLVIRGII